MPGTASQCQRRTPRDLPDLLGLIRLLRRCGLLQRRSVSVRLVDAISHALDDGPYSSAWRPPRCLRSSSAAPSTAAAPLASRGTDALGVRTPRSRRSRWHFRTCAPRTVTGPFSCRRGRRIRPGQTPRSRQVLPDGCTSGAHPCRHESSLGGRMYTGDKRVLRESEMLRSVGKNPVKHFSFILTLLVPCFAFPLRSGIIPPRRESGKRGGSSSPR